MDDFAGHTQVGRGFYIREDTQYPIAGGQGVSRVSPEQSVVLLS